MLLVNHKGSVGVIPSAAELISKYQYTYDDNSNRIQQIETHHDSQDPADPSKVSDRTYHYDRVNGLGAIINNADPTQSIAYDYDENGNRISKTVGQVTVMPDASGNPITIIINPISTLTYEYGIRDELLRTPDLNGGFVTFDYDASRMRVKKISPTGQPSQGGVRPDNNSQEQEGILNNLLFSTGNSTN